MRIIIVAPTLPNTMRVSSVLRDVKPMLGGVRLSSVLVAFERCVDLRRVAFHCVAFWSNCVSVALELRLSCALVRSSFVLRHCVDSISVAFFILRCVYNNMDRRQHVCHVCGVSTTLFANHLASAHKLFDHAAERVCLFG
jgi:hypothetical protein